MTDILFWVIIGVLGVIMLIYYGRCEKPIRTAFFGMFSGGTTLVIAHFLVEQYDMELKLNLFNSLISLILGIPGVIALIIAQFVIL